MKTRSYTDNKANSKNNSGGRDDSGGFCWFLSHLEGYVEDFAAAATT